jgi:hypothetical protein
MVHPDSSNINHKLLATSRSASRVLTIGKANLLACDRISLINTVYINQYSASL